MSDKKVINESLCKKICEIFPIRRSIMEKGDLQKTSKKTKILIALMFLSLMSPKAWGYAQGELPPSFSEGTFSSGETFSSDQTFSFSRAVLTDENGLAICQVNLAENPEFLPQFAEPGASNALKPLDLPECEEESLDVVAQYAEQAWIKRDVAIAPVVVGVVGIGAVSSFFGGCLIGIGSFKATEAEHVNLGKNTYPFIGAGFGGINGGILSRRVGL